MVCGQAKFWLLLCVFLTSFFFFMEVSLMIGNRKFVSQSRLEYIYPFCFTLPSVRMIRVLLCILTLVRVIRFRMLLA
uniref:Uncharacterized protein n=1 Tax=Arundo donax TaxID=35708 RepID=A0A0A9G2V4_ARUDO